MYIDFILNETNFKYIKNGNNNIALLTNLHNNGNIEHKISFYGGIYTILLINESMYEEILLLEVNQCSNMTLLIINIL